MERESEMSKSSQDVNSIDTISSQVNMRKIKQYLYEVQSKYNLKAAYLFGSQVTGKAHEWSDIDILLISPDFSGNRIDTRVELMGLTWDIDGRIEPHPMTPDEFELSNPLAAEVMKTGVEIGKGLLEKPGYN
jgi:predicted nucleotidyltransferase